MNVPCSGMQAIQTRYKGYHFRSRLEARWAVFFDTLGILWEYEKEGLSKLEAEPERFKKFDSPNGWGLYIHFVPFVKAVLEACEEYPDADIEVSR